MAELAALLEILLDGGRIRAAADLRSASARPGLQRLLLILQTGLAEEDRRKGFEGWTGDQVDALIVAARAVAVAALSSPVELVEPLVVAIIEKALDFCLKFLEKSSFDGDDFSLQDRVLQFLDIALGNGSFELHDAHDIQPTSLVVGRLSSILITSTVTDLTNVCYLPDFNCLKNKKTSASSLLSTFSSEILQPSSTSKQPTVSASSTLISSTARHLALNHLMYVPRLLSLCGSLLVPPALPEKLEETNLVPRLSHCLKLLKLLKALVVEFPPDSSDTELLNSVSSFVDSVPGLLKLIIDFGTIDSTSYGDVLSSILVKMLDEFIQFVRVACQAGDVYRTIEACLVASMLEILSVKSSQHERLSSSLRAPLVFSPRIVQYLLKSISAGCWVSQSVGADTISDLGTVGDAPSCLVRSEKVSLLKKHTYEDRRRLIFPPSEQWIDDLIHLVLFLHTIAVKSVSVTDKPRTTISKASTISDTESVVSHDDEAIFGDLFAEASRPSGAPDATEKAVPGSGISDNTIVSCPPIQVVAELVSFLKTYIFSPGWDLQVHKDACAKVSPEHISQLLSLLSCQNSSCAERIMEPSQCSLNELCFDLLRALIVCRGVPLSIKEKLVTQVMLVENGAFVYNHYTLALVAHYLVSGDDLGASTNFRFSLFSGYLAFLHDRADNAILTESNDLSVALPCAFHLEMLLMAFHLSSQAEKETLARQVFSTLKKMAATSPPVAVLSVWGLLVSRVFLLLRHMFLYPSSCPIWLVSQFRAKMREVPVRPEVGASYMNEHLPSLVSTVLVGMFGDIIRESPVTSSLLPWLIDVAPLNAAHCPDELQLQNLGFDLLDMLDTISTVLDYWKGQRVESPDLLIVERYLFLLFWNTLLAIEPGMKHTLGSFDAEKLKLSDVRVFLSFSLSLARESGASSEEEILPVATMVSAFKRLHDDILLSTVDVDNWNFLRRSSGLSLLLSVINAGLDNFARPDLQARPFYNLGESIVKYLDEKQAGEFVISLAYVLETYLRITQQTFLSFLDQAGSLTGDQFCPILLLKHTTIDKSKQNLLLGMVGSDIGRLETIYGLLHKLDGIGAKLGTGKIGSYCLSGSLFHGFPVYPDSCNGTLLSCILVVRELIGVIDGILKVMGEKGLKLGDSVACRVLRLVMAVNSDRIFGSLSQKCDAVFNVLISEKLHLKGYMSLFALKQFEEFLTHVNSAKGLRCELREMLISTVADSIEVLRRDSSKSEVFKFYLGCDDSGTQEAESLFGYCHADLLALFIALGECESETANLKVIGLLNDVLAGGMCSSLKEELRKRFLDTDTDFLSHWLEARLLGVGAVAASVRDLTVDFLMHLMSPEFQAHLGESMLVLLDTAFLQRDLQTAEPYFGFLVKLLSCESSSMKLLLGSTLKLMDKMVEKESLLTSLKFLLMFVEAVIGQSAVQNESFSRKVSSKISSSSKVASGSMLSTKQPGSGKNTDNLQVASDSVLVKQVDITSSGEEDEDDGTTDGELASVDRDHEEEDMNSERVLASKVCTFTSSGSNFMEQHWYFCYTCDLTVSKGCCSVCARVCHRGHRVVYSRSSRFFCDCGAGGVRGSSCQCLKPRKFTGHGGQTTSTVGNVSGFPTFVPYQDEADPVVDSCSDLDDEMMCDASDCSFKLSIPKELQDELQEILHELGVESKIVEICNKLLPRVTSRREDNHLKDRRVMLGADKRVQYTTSLFQLKKAFKSGSMDLKIKADYPNSRELKLHLSSGSLAKSLLSVSVRGKLAVGEGDKVAIFDIGQLIGQPTVTPVTADKTNVKPLSKNMVRFEIVHLIFNPLVESYLAVAGYEECQVLTVNSRGEVTDRLAIELALTDGAYLRKVEWVPGSQVQLMVTSNKFVKIYDLSQDNISPVHYFTLENDRIVDTALLPAPMGKVVLLVLSEAGLLYKFEVSMEGDVGARILTDVIVVEGKGTQSRGVSLYFSSTYRLLFLAYQDGTTLLGRLDPDSKGLSEVSYVNEEVDGKVKPVELHHWRELIAGTGIFSCQSSSKPNVILTVVLGPHELTAQNMKHSMGSNSATMVGVAAYKPLSEDKTNCLILYDDGSLHIFSYNDTSVESTGRGETTEQKKKLGTSILNNKAYTGANPEFPLDFFEKTVCITGDVKLSSDAYKGGDPESIKQRLASEDGYLEGPTSSAFKVTVSNPNPDIVMVGCRIHVGNTSVSHIPSEISLFHRAIKLDEGMKSWYDIPFTTAESLLADEEFTITVGPTHDKLSTPRLDFFEIYGRAKDDFGWKEKMEEVLNLEASTQTGADSGKRHLTIGASIEEQVLADALKILASVYLLCGPHLNDADLMELRKMRCGDLLEIVFQSDREPLLQFSACRVLQSIFPKRETYYHVKDSLRLLGVIKSFPLISSRIGVGGAASSWVIKEFIAQIQAVSKIALNRKFNIAAFLQTNGSEVVDGLMEVFWGILTLERPDTQTINSLVVPCVDLIYSYAECLASIAEEEATTLAVAPAVSLLKKLLFAPYEAVQTSSSLAISSRLLQVPFPKQTMINATDDVAESRAQPTPSDAAGPATNTNILIEEDPSTSSVQYCCDGCSTVPIVRRRWHCTVCPDFDLCETCYEVLDADQLPPPHSRDHAMTAIPIELESMGGDGTDIHFTLDELTDPGSVRSLAARNSTERGTRESSLTPAAPSSIHVLEMNDAPELVNQRVVSISASKRAVNSLLLRGLIEELNGWMEVTSGLRAIPIMQLFYRLSSAVGGPFMDGVKTENLDLEKFVRWLLDEINLSRPFPARARSSIGEVAILVFMFFTLMFRNWHQPSGSGSDNSSSQPKPDSQDKGFTQVSAFSSTPSSTDEQEKEEFTSQLVRACSYLRNQEFLNYLLDILQQLMHVFKSSSGSAEGGLVSGPGCGSLLTVRRELPAGNFSPFFSDSYAKSHPKDLFADYHKLLLENTFRLVYSMVRPEKHEKSAEKDNKVYRPAISAGSKDLKLDGYQDVLCYYISNPSTTFVRRYARRLFLHICGSKTQYYSTRDAWQYSHEVKRLYKIVNKSGGFKNPVPYERSVKLIKCLTTLCEVAASRPKNWQKYCLKHPDVLPFLTKSVFYFGEESIVQSLKLLNLAFYTGKELNQKLDCATAEVPSASKLDSKKKKKGEDGGENSSSEKSCVDMEHALEMFIVKDAALLRQFVDTFLLEWSSASVRSEAKCVLYGVWHHARGMFKETILKALLQKVRCLPMYGQNIVEYTDLMAWLLGKGAVTNTSTGTGTSKTQEKEREIVSKCLTSDVISSIFETLHAQNELLANHPNSRIYNTLSTLVEFDGYYLESEPCVSCSCPDVPYTRMKLETIKSETKYTDNRIIVKCTGCFMIQSLTMNVHDARKSKSVKVLNLYYSNRPGTDLSELKNNWSLWKKAKSCHLAANQTELKVEFSIPITACNLMIELDSFYENLQASSLESLQCPRCSRAVTDKHGICSNCHENAYQCRQCRNINYENLDSFLCNECGYSKYGRFEFHFMAKPSFSFDNMENDDDMRKGLAAIETESENAHRRYQQLLGFKKPLVKLVSSIGEHEMDSQQKDTVQQMMVSLPGPSCKVNRKIALLGVLYGEKCKAAFDSVSKSVQTLQGLRRVLMTYLHQKSSNDVGPAAQSLFANARSTNSCYGCATTFITQCLELLQVLSKHPICKKHLISSGILSELFENNIHHGPRATRVLARAVISAFSEGDAEAVAELNGLIKKKVMYCLEHHRSMDVASATREELLLLSETCAMVDEFWESRLRIAFQILFSSIKVGAKHPAISENIILPCLRIVSQACTPPRSDSSVDGKEQEKGRSRSSVLQSRTDKTVSDGNEKSGSDSGSRKGGQEVPLLSYTEWERGASYLDFVRRQYKVSQAVKTGPAIQKSTQKSEYLVLKYGLRWKRRALRHASRSDFSKFALGSWVSELILSACSQSIRSEVSTLINLLFPVGSARQFQLLNLLVTLLPATLDAGESAAEYFELFFGMVEPEAARLFLTVRGCLRTICGLITKEVANVESQERTLAVDISQGFILHKLIELLNKFLEVPNIRARFMRDELLSEVLEVYLIIRGLVIQKTKLISDCNRLLKELLDGLVLESTDNKQQFIRACVAGLQKHATEHKRRTSLFILEQLCNMICPTKPEPVYLLVLNKAHTQEEFIRGSMTKNPYSSTEIGPLMRDVKNKICHQLDLMGLVEDDYGMELLVAGNIISLDLSISQVYEQVWKKHHSGSHGTLAAALAGVAASSQRDSLPMTVTYRLQGLDGEATEPMIKELEEEKEESQDPEVEFAIAGAVRECGGLEIILSMIQRLRDEDLRSNQEELGSVLNLLCYCCKIRENRRALLRLGALGLLLETARRAFSVDAMESAEGILLIVESLTIEANESDISITQSVHTEENAGVGEQSRKIVLMFLERLCHPVGTKRSSKQQRNDEMVARILPYLTYGEPSAMDALIQHFEPYLNDWPSFDRVQNEYAENLKDEKIGQQALCQKSAIENFVRVSESLNSSSCGERLKDMILAKGITAAAVRHLRNSFGDAEAKPECFKNHAEWVTGLRLPSVPLILSLLRALSKGHFDTQKCIDEEGLLPLLHALEGVVGEKEIGAKAENLLDTLANKENNGDGFLGQKIDELRHATKEEMRRRALKKREMLLQGLGMKQEFGSDGGKRILVSQPFIEGLDDVEEETDGLACMVCREGYTLRPNDILGVYSFAKRVNLGTGAHATGSGAGTGLTRGDCVYTSVSHFNIIHFQCHQEAKRADAALKNPKKEWEGAALRNNETLCNCIFPLRGPAVPLVQYARFVDQYWDNLSALGRADGGRLRLITYDIVLMLARFATGAAFNSDSRGGGRESNSRYLLFMVQMASYLLDQGNSNPSQQRRAMAKTISTYLSNGTSSTASPPPPIGGSRITTPSIPTEENVQFMMVSSLLSNSYEEWVQHRPSFLQRGIYHAHMQHKHGSSSDAESSKLFTIVQPMLVYTGLIEQLQRFFKVNKRSQAKEESGLERWEVVMRERMLNIKEMVGFSDELLEWLDDMTSASDLQEAFDVMGALEDVYSHGFTQCEDFVRAAISSGKS